MHLELDLPDARLTAADFQALPEIEGFRLELWEGNLVVTAAAQMAWHSATARRVEDLFRATGREVVREVGVVVASRDVPPKVPLEALVSTYRLTPAGSYGLAEKQPLSALEARDR